MRGIVLWRWNPAESNPAAVQAGVSPQRDVDGGVFPRYNGAKGNILPLGKAGDHGLFPT